MDEVFIDIRKENTGIRKYFDTDFVSTEQLLATIEDLDGEVENWKEKYQDLLDKIKKRLDAVEQHEFQIQMIDRWDAGDKLVDTLLTREINALKSFINEENI